MRDINNVQYNIEICTCFNIRRAARVVSQFYDKYLYKCGLRATQFMVLKTISDNENITLMPLAKILGMDRTTLSRNIKPLERDNLITIMIGKDRRTQVITLTLEGKATVELAIPFWLEAQKEAKKILGENRWERMMADLTMTGSSFPE